MSYEEPVRRPKAPNAPTGEDLRNGRFTTRGGPPRGKAAPKPNTPGQTPPVRRYLSREQAEALYQKHLEQQRQRKASQE
jgi:hypothetical protein